MNPGELSKLFHMQTTEAQSAGIPSDSKAWPEEWKTIYYKEYPRFPQITLPYRDTLNVDIAEILSKHESSRLFDHVQNISLEDLGTLLKAGVGTHVRKNGKEGRAYPSGGARYPIEVYLSLAKNSAVGLKEDLYHYNFKTHTLEHMEYFETEEQNIRKCLTYKWAERAPVVIILTAMWWRTMNKYKDFGYHLSLIEAGHMAQNLITISTALGLGSCPLAGIHKNETSKVLGLDPSYEAPLYALALGYPQEPRESL